MNPISLLNPPIPQTSGDKLHWGNLQGCAAALAICQAAKQKRGLYVVITTDSLQANQLQEEIKFFLNADPAIPILNFPDHETLPYDSFSPHQDIISERLATLFRLPTVAEGIVIISCTTLMQRLLPRQYLEQHSFVIDKGDTINLDELRRRLDAAAYHNVSQVIEHGEFAIRGSIIDIFPMGSKTPFRIDLFDNSVDSIRIFDPENQRSSEIVPNIRLLPAKEYLLSTEAITHFRQAWRDNFSGNPTQCPIYQNVSQGLSAPGIEYYLPLFFDNLQTFFDYLPAAAIVIKTSNFQQAMQNFWQEIAERYEQLRHDISKPILEPTKLFLRDNELFSALNQFSQIQIHTELIEAKLGRTNFKVEPPANLPIDRRSKNPFHNLQNYLATISKPVLFCAESLGRKEALIDMLQKIDVKPQNFATWQDFINDPKIGITIAPLSQGLNAELPALSLITESQLFGEQVYQRRYSKSKYAPSTDTIVRNLMELSVGTPIVHIDHGIGRYLGLQALTIDNTENEFLVIAYADNAKLYVPVSALHLISRYSGSDADNAPLNKLGTEQWSKARKKAAEKIRDVAAELLEINAKRAAKKGYQFKLVKGNYQNFASSFPFEETQDQEQAITDTIADMCAEKTMDRLICGDVGFGKTEVAMRAAFIAAENGKQVAILVPTTLLAQQHYENFKNRFAEWPINIEVISRFKSTTEQKKILEQLALGKIDIIIGTHKLIQKNILFKNLGLLIVDEEHRFGVQQKEKLKSLRHEVDILSLTATPIPRTLNMSLAGIRDFSIIATPPNRRLAVKTFVQEKKKHIIREAIMRELMRGGQVYYLHNSVETIEKTAKDLTAIIPEISLAIAHGQMPEKQLERIMSDFYHHRVNLLVCTTIVESGIDIPTANTIIIDRADKFGLAQLHQLRGRVGRSHHQAYAYLFIPDWKTITKDAQKRLDAIAAYEDLGAGFMLATHDLEIRGAGELLGEEQSGHIQAIGFSLYMELLERAVKSLQAGKVLNVETELHHETEIELKIPALIPESYIGDVHTRLILYKRIASAVTHDHLNDLQIEIIDRFGLLPQQIKNLFAVTELKLLAKAIGIRKIEANQQEGAILFEEQPNIDPGHLIKLVQIHPKLYKFAGQNRIKFYFHPPVEKQQQLPEKVSNVLETLSKK